MFDNLFSSSPAIWTVLVAGMIAVPLLIHLINLVRHRRIEWAAMEFLLKSHQNNRNWVRLKQLLLLLSRIAALLLALFMLAQVGCHEDRIARLLGGSTIHHYVLLDDSFSMSDRESGAAAFDRARATLSLIAARAKNRQNQRFSLVRFSRAALANGSEARPLGLGRATELDGEILDTWFDQRLEDVKSKLRVSNLAHGPLEALKTARAMIAARKNENAIVYILSDFRAKDWESSSEIDNQLLQIHQIGAAVEMINCVKTGQPNLAITLLQPVGHVRAAATPLMMGLTIKNCSTAVAEKIQVRIATFNYPSTVDRTNFTELQHNREDLPTVFVESIGAGESATRQFPVYFSKPGQHVIFAQLADDAVLADNQNWNVTEFSTGSGVLVIDDQQELHSGALTLALSPGGMTGIRPEFRTKDFLRDAPAEQLDEFDVIFMLDVDRLDDSSVEKLEQYCRAGGGVGFFMGPKSNLPFYNDQLHRQGKGIFPLPLEKTIDVPESGDKQIPDILPQQHPIFAPLLGLKNSPLDLVQVNRIVQPPPDWEAADNSNVFVAATVRGMNSWPLVATSRFASGYVAVITTTAGPIWNNWTRNGTFPPILLLLEDYLASGRYQSHLRLVGEPIEVMVSGNQYLPDVTFAIPTYDQAARGEPERIAVQRKTQPGGPMGEYQSITLGPAELAEGFLDELGQTLLPGIYDLLLTATDGKNELRRYALNVDTAESDLALANRQQLLARLEPVKPTFTNWDEFNSEPKRIAASSFSKVLLLLLTLLLIGEQLLAYSASYHAKTAPIKPAPKRRRVLAS